MGGEAVAVGMAVTGAGYQWGLKGSQPTGALPYNVQVALTKGFNNAPFRIYLKAQHLQTWDLALPGTYDDTIDPITQEVVTNSTFKFGDQLMRHVTIGTALSAGESMEIWFGFDYRRRTELMATDRINGNGFSFGTQFQFGKLACASAVRGITLPVLRPTLESASIRGNLGAHNRFTCVKLHPRWNCVKSTLQSTAILQPARARWPKRWPRS